MSTTMLGSIPCLAGTRLSAFIWRMKSSVKAPSTVSHSRRESLAWLIMQPSVCGGMTTHSPFLSGTFISRCSNIRLPSSTTSHSGASQVESR